MELNHRVMDHLHWQRLFAKLLAIGTRDSKIEMCIATQRG
jgi:hypothetical protein